MRLPLRYHRRTEAVSPVIGEVLMVAIVIVLAAVVWLVVSGMMMTPDDERLTVTLSKPNMQQRSSVYDASVNIYDVAPDGEKVQWIEVRVLVNAYNGSSLNQSMTMVDDTNATYHDYVEFWYVEQTPGDTKLNTGDGIKITGMSRTYEGATVTLVRGSYKIGEVKLPTHF